MDTNNGFTPGTAKLTINNATGTVNPNGIVNIADGTYSEENNTNITLNKNMTIIGESQEGTIINGTGTNWIFNITAGVNVNIFNLTITNGTNLEGGAIFNQGNLTVQNCTFTNNTATGSHPFGGGAILNYCLGSSSLDCIVTDCTFIGNNANYQENGGNGGAILNYIDSTGSINCTVKNSYFAFNQARGGGAIFNTGYTSINCNVTNCSFTNNTAYRLGGAIYTGAYNTCNVNESTFTGNKAGVYGGALSFDNSAGPCTVIGSIFINNEAGNGGAIRVWNTLNAHFNRFYNNTGFSGDAISRNGNDNTVNVTLNWWGSNTDPSTINNLIVGTVLSDPWLVLGIDANQPSIYNGETSTVTVNLLHDSGILTDPEHPELYYHDPANGHVPDGIPVTFSLIDGPLGTLGSQTTFINGAASIIFTATSVGVQHVNATIDDKKVTATINIDPIGHVNVTKTADNYTPNYWSLVTFTVTAHNDGPNDVAGLQITDLIPTGLNLVSADTHGFGTYVAGLWDIGTLANGTTAILTLVVNATTTGTFTNWANVTAQTTHDTQAWSKDNATITVPLAADIAVVKAFYDYDGEYQITSGNYWDIVSTRILVTNNGPDTATNVVISDILGSGLTFVDEWWVKLNINDPLWDWNGTSFDPDTMTWTIPSLPAGQTAALDIMTNLTSTGTLHNYAELMSSTTYDWNQSNNNDTAYITVPAASYLSISKEFMDLPWGNVITNAYYNAKIYAIVKVHNQGPDSTTSVNVLDLLNGLTWTGNYYVYRTPGSYPNTEAAWVLNDPEHPFNGTNWDVGSLSTMIGSSRWLAIEVIVNQTGTVSNYAETVDQSSYPYQGYANYTAYLTTNITPTLITVDDVRGNKGDTVTLKAVLTDYLGNALVGETVEFWIDGVKVGENTTDVNGTALFNYVISQTPGNHNLTSIFSETALYQGCNATGELYVPSANLYIQITSNNNNPTVGETFTLRYKLGNKGPDDALNVTITIPIPDGFVISKIEGDGNWTIVGNNIIWTFNNVTVGDPDLYVSGWTRWAGSFLFGASILSDTFNLNSLGVNSFSLNAAPQVNAESVTNTTIGMQNTGASIVPLALALLGVVGGLIATRKKQ